MDEDVFGLPGAIIHTGSIDVVEESHGQRGG